MVTANVYGGKEVGHVMVTVGEEENRVHIAPGLMDWNSHCLFSPDGKFVSCDGYINKDMYRSWALLRLEDWAVIPIGTFYVPKIYKNIYTHRTVERFANIQCNNVTLYSHMRQKHRYQYYA